MVLVNLIATNSKRFLPLSSSLYGCWVACLLKAFLIKKVRNFPRILVGGIAFYVDQMWGRDERDFLRFFALSGRCMTGVSENLQKREKFFKKELAQFVQTCSFTNFISCVPIV